MKIDLHSHTCYSDGQLTPKELIDRAHNMQLDVLAITDHDSLDALPEAHAYQATQKRQLRILNGVEFSTGWHNFDIHILGLNLPLDDETFNARLAQQHHTRLQRAIKIGEKLAKAGIEGTYDDAKAMAGKGQVTRAHFARVLVQRGEVSDFDAAFKKYLGKGKRAHVKPDWISIQQAIEWIQDAGGKAVLAHPGRYDLSGKWLRKLVVEFAQAGGDGLEVVHHGLSPDTRNLLASFCHEYDLQASAGSDFHFPNRWTELGRNLGIPLVLEPVWQDWDWATELNQARAQALLDAQH